MLIEMVDRVLTTKDYVNYYDLALFFPVLAERCVDMRNRIYNDGFGRNADIRVASG